MKIITEEDVNFICNIIDGVDDSLDDLDKRNIITLLLGHIQEIDTLTVSKLRPMVDAPIREVVLLKSKSKKINHLVQQVVTENTRHLWVGWLPMPIYKPEKE